MSGGSFNYLYAQDFEQILQKERDLSDMVDTLAQRGYEDVAKETESLLLLIRQYRVRVDTRIERLSGVWKSVEYAESGDWSWDSVEEVVEKYRNKD